MPDTFLMLEHISHAFEDGELVLNDISLKMNRGEVMALIGPSGCGKTTTLRLIAGLEELQVGRITMDETVLAGGDAEIPPENRGIGLVFQDYALFPHLNVYKNVVFGIENRPKGEQKRRTMEVLEQVGMAKYADVYPHQLSGGQQQRVALARALAPSPKLVLLDEPFSGLDPDLRGVIRNDTLRILSEQGTAAILVTHDPEEAMYLCDHIALMNKGEIVQSGNPEELYCKPNSPFAVRFFASSNVFSGVVEKGHVETPFGPIPAPGLPDNAPAEVFIRPESLRFDAKGGIGKAEACVKGSRFLRRSILTTLDFGDFRGTNIQLRSRTAGHYIPETGSHITVTLDPDQTFVFPGLSNSDSGRVNDGGSIRTNFSDTGADNSRP